MKERYVKNKNEAGGYQKIKKNVILGVVLMFIFTLLIPIQNVGAETNTHTILAEKSSASWCPHCPGASYYLYQTYLSNSDFYFVTLVSDKNSYTYSRMSELGVHLYPTVDFDGRYNRVTGNQYSTSNYQNAVDNCKSRTVENIGLSISAVWMYNGKIQILATLHNYEDSVFNGNIIIYITEITSRWNDYSGNPYHYAMIGNYAIKQNINLLPGEIESISSLYQGPTDISLNNIKIVGSISNSQDTYSVETVATDPILPYLTDINIDIKPNSYPNSINPKSNGKLPVAVLTTESFCATDIDISSIDFLGSPPSLWAIDDIDGDGDNDLTLHFNIPNLDFSLLVDEGDDYPQAYLYGEISSGVLAIGKDTMRLVGQNSYTILDWILKHLNFSWINFQPLSLFI